LISELVADRFELLNSGRSSKGVLSGLFRVLVTMSRYPKGNDNLGIPRS